MNISYAMLALGAVIVCVPLLLVFIFHLKINQWVTVVLFDATTQLMVTAKDTGDPQYMDAWGVIKEAFEQHPTKNLELDMDELFGQVRKSLDLRVRTEQQIGSDGVKLSKRALGLFDHWQFLLLREFQRNDKNDVRIRLKVTYILRILAKI